MSAPLLILLGLLDGSCPPATDTLWKVLRSGDVAGGCVASSDSVLAQRGAGEPASAFLRRAGNLLVAAGRPSQGLDLLARARAAGGAPEDSLLAESAEALLALGRIEQAVAATYALGPDPSAVLLLERARVFSAAGLEEEGNKALRDAFAKDARSARSWKWDRRPSLTFVGSWRYDREEKSVDSAFHRRIVLQNGLLPTRLQDATIGPDTTVDLGGAGSGFLQADWGGGSSAWRLEGNVSTWGVRLQSDPSSLPWGFGTGLGLRRQWSPNAWTRISTGWQRSWRDGDFEEDDIDGMLATGGSWGAFSASLSHRQVAARTTDGWTPSNGTSCAFGWSPSRGPDWSASGSLAWSGGKDSRFSYVIPASVWRTRGVQEGIRLWSSDRHPPAWTLVDSTGASYDSARMVDISMRGERSRYYPAISPSDVEIVDFRPAAYWSPSLSLGLSQALPWEFRVGAAAGVGWRLWSQAETILLGDPWSARTSTGSLVMARDEESGKLFIVTDPKGGTFVALDETRRRRDHWTTLSITLSWTPLSWTSWQIGWRGTETSTNVADIDSTVASLRSTWSLDGSVWW